MHGGANAPCQPRFLFPQGPGFLFYLTPVDKKVKGIAQSYSGQGICYLHGQRKKCIEFAGHPPSFRTRRCRNMEHFLLNVMAAVVAGVIVAWIVKRFNR